MVRRLIWVIVFLLLILTFFVINWLYLSEEEPSGKIFDNPDLIMGKNDELIRTISLKKNIDLWMGEGLYIYGPVDGDYGIIVFPPMSRDSERVIGRFVSLEEDKSYDLTIKMGNVAGKTYMAGTTGCDDVIIEIKLLDYINGDEHLIDSAIVNSNDGWVQKSYDLTPYKGKIYYLRISGVAGGPCGNWSGEWSAISYINLT